MTTWLENGDGGGGGKAYLLNDVRTVTGRTNVAKFNKFENEWNKIVEGHNDTTLVQDKIFDLILLFADKGSASNIYFGPREGMHRFIGQVQALIASPITIDSGIFRKGGIDVSDFKKLEIEMQEPIISDVELNEKIKLVLEGESKGMMDEVIHMKLIYISERDTNVSLLMNAMRDTSQAISNAKVASARPSTTFLIGDWAEKFIRSMTIESLQCDPNISEVNVNKVPRSKLKDCETLYSLDSEGDEDKAFPSCALLRDPALLAYIKDPFNDDNKKQVLDLLSLEGVDQTKSHRPKSVSVPPHFISFSTLAVKAGDCIGGLHRLNGEIANEYFIAPVIYRYLYAGKHNITVSQTLNEPQVESMIQYILRYHLGAESGYGSIWKTHPALNLVYNIVGSSNSTTISANGLEIIGATVILTDMINAVIGEVSRHPHLTYEERLKRVNDAGSLLGMALKCIDTVTPSISSTISHLGT